MSLVTPASAHWAELQVKLWPAAFSWPGLDTPSLFHVCIPRLSPPGDRIVGRWRARLEGCPPEKIGGGGWSECLMPVLVRVGSAHYWTHRRACHPEIGFILRAGYSRAAAGVFLAIRDTEKPDNLGHGKCVTQAGLRFGQQQWQQGKRSEAGMTLVEVVFALAVSGLAIAGIVSGYVFAVGAAEESALSLAASGRAME